MKCDKKYKEWIWLSVYGELEKQKADELARHLKSCEHCREELASAKHFFEKMNEKESVHASGEVLQQSRQALFHRVRMAARYGTRPLWQNKLHQIVTLDFRPQWRVAAVLGMLILGIFAGAKLFRQPAQLNSALFREMAQQPESIDRIENVSFDEQKNQVRVQFQTVQAHNVQGNPDDPMIQKLLAQTLVSDSRPNLRLRSVNALRETKSFSQQVLEALIEVLEKDDNVGVRLKTIKILNSIPWDERVQPMLTRIFIKVLLQEKNSAVRIAAVDGLERIRNRDAVSILNKAAEKDSNDYVRLKATDLLEKLKNSEKLELKKQ